MRQWTVAILSTLILAGCASSNVGSVVTVNTPTIPTANPLDKPRLQLRPFEMDVPRDMSKRDVKNIPACRNVAVKDRDARFWSQCATYPPDSKSNLLIGFDEPNYETWLENQNTTETHIKKLEDRIDAANSEREYWRNRANELQQRQQNERQNLIDSSRGLFNRD